MERGAHWQASLRGFNISSTVYSAEEWIRTRHEPDLLVLAGVEMLSAGQRDRVLDHLRRGGGLILTGQTGVRTGEGVSETLAERLGLEYRVLDREEGSTWWVSFDRVGHLTAGIPRMQRISVDFQELVALRNPREALPWASWFDSDVRGGVVANGAPMPSLDDEVSLLWPGAGQRPVAADPEEAYRRVAIHHGEHGGGRFIWMAFDAGEVGGDLASSEGFARFMQNGLDFLRGLPTVELAPWPFPHATAILFSMDVEERFGNFRNVLEIEELPSITFFILTDSAGLYDQDLAAAAKLPERGGRAEIAVHGDNHDLFRGQPHEKQHQRLRRARQYIDEIAPHPPRGFRPPEEAYDFFTLRSLLENGYRYLLGNENPDRAEPIIQRIRDQRFLQLTMLNKDDVDQVVRAHQPNPETVLRNYIEDMDRIFERQGLFIVNFHSQILATERYIGVLGDMVRYARERGAWMVNGLEMYDWWMARDEVDFSVVSRTNRYIDIAVGNRGRQALRDLAVNIWIPEEGEHGWQVEALPSGRRVPDYHTEGGFLRLHLRNLPGGQTENYRIRWRQ